MQHLMISFLRMKPLSRILLMLAVGPYITLTVFIYESIFYESSHKGSGKYFHNRQAYKELGINPEGLVKSSCGNVDKTGFQKVTTGIYVYSAHLDSRLNDHDIKKGELRWIRVIAIADSQRNLFYHVRKPGEFRYSSTKAMYYELCENHNMPFGGFIISCQLPEKFHFDKPCSVTVSIEEDLDNAASLSAHAQIPLKLLKQEKTTKQHGVCIPPLFGNISRHKLI